MSCFLLCVRHDDTLDLQLATWSNLRGMARRTQPSTFQKGKGTAVLVCLALTDQTVALNQVPELPASLTCASLRTSVPTASRSSKCGHTTHWDPNIHRHKLMSSSEL
jgi:hypothetical protein